MNSWKMNNWKELEKFRDEFFYQIRTHTGLSSMNKDFIDSFTIAMISTSLYDMDEIVNRGIILLHKLQRIRNTYR